MIGVDIDLQWSEVWSRPDPTCPISCGVDYAIDEQERKLYRAYARTSVPVYDVKYSPSYVACDAADVQVNDTGRVLMQSDRDRLVSAAAAVRALMSADEKSPSDMVAVAESLQGQALKNFRKWERDEVERVAKELDDEQALLTFRHWLRGASLLWERGTAEEKKQLARFMK